MQHNSRFLEQRLSLLKRIPEIIEFVRKYEQGIFAPQSDAELIDIFMQHINFGTLIIMDDSDGITVFERWNYIDQYIFYSLDTIIRPDRRSISTIKELMKFGIENSLYPQTLRWVLYQKGQHMALGYRIHDVEKFLGNGKYKLNRGGAK